MTVKRACLGCGRLVPASRNRCRACQTTIDRQRNARRDRRTLAIYPTIAWRRLAAAVVADAWRCHWCHRTGVRLTADHVLSIVERPDLALEPSNLVAACYSCQNRRRRGTKESRPA